MMTPTSPTPIFQSLTKWLNGKQTQQPGSHDTGQLAKPANDCTKIHLRPQDTRLSLEKTVRDLVIQWSLHLQDSQELQTVLARYAYLLMTPTLFREVLEEMIDERSKQGDSHEE